MPASPPVPRPVPRSRPGPACRSARVAGHFGEFLQGRLGPDGPVALVTVPCPALEVRAVWRPGQMAGLWQGGRPVLAQGQVARLARLFGIAPGRLRLFVGMPPGGGAGASTAALLAAIRCLAPIALSPDTEAALCLALEGATDPLMQPVPEALLWAPRAARVLGRLAPGPGFEIVGGFAGPGRRTDPADTAFPDISDLVAAWRVTTDRAGRAQLATESARRCHALRGGPDPAPIWALGRDLGALGLVAAHTGPALGLLFAPGDAPRQTETALRAAGLGRVLRFRTGGGR
ncbi:threonine kinase [Rhodovulum visakhapatnamense]|uniref:Threonine kinase n=1 Tax=Rhodovulum visakhapatnamense TaxID=364297 RepID=A0A4R8FXT0_9RHOB|nr:threonine kinase [Rhodovulum visakhapatnamense]